MDPARNEATDPASHSATGDAMPHETRAAMQAVLDVLPSNSCIVDPDGMIVAVNRSWRTYAADNGYPADDNGMTTGGIGTNYLSACTATAHPPHPQSALAVRSAGAVRDGLRAVLDGNRETFVSEYPCETAGNVLWYRVSIARLKAPIEGALIRHVDVSWNHRMARAADDAAEQLRETQREMTQVTDQMRSEKKELESFSYRLSHDMKTPLRAISGYASILSEELADSLDTTHRSYLNRILEVANQSGGMIDALLELTRLSARKLTPQRFDLVPVIRDLVEHLRITEEKEILCMTPDRIEIDADLDLMRTLVMNVLTNAVKYADSTKDLVIGVDVEEGDQEVTIGFADNGLGIDEADVERIFDPFVRARNAGIAPGTGIGLSTVRRIVENHGGNVWATNGHKEGAIFYISLPKRTSGPSEENLTDRA